MQNRFSRRNFLVVSTLAALQSLCRSAKATLLREQRPSEIFPKLTLEEKIGLCHGSFQAGGVPRLGIPAIAMRDGRQNIRPTPKDKIQQTTSLPCTLSLSCTWNPDAATTFGSLLAEELLAIGGNVLFGPCINLGRSPLDGRIFENLGEDPFLAGTMASRYIRGAQDKGVAGCSCLLVANDCEAHRHFTSSNMDERTLREMHLLPYEMSITDGHVWVIMAANNLLNGTHDAENRHLIQEIVKDQLRFDGVMITDWRAAYNPEATALAGTDMTTGFCGYVFGDGRLLQDVKSGKVPESLIDEKVRRILKLYDRSGVLSPALRGKGSVDTPAHRDLARKLGSEGMVLLKNERHLLPLNQAKQQKILVTGPAADTVPSGKGSGGVKSAPFEVSPWQGLKSALGDQVLLASDDLAQQQAQTADVVLFFAHDQLHGEESDLQDFDLPGNQAKTIANLAAINPNIVVILLTGGAISLEPWADVVPSILASWYAGQSTGDAIADVLIGKVNPSGKLSRTFGKQLKDYACHALNLWPPRLILDKPPGSAGYKPEERKDIYAYAADYKEGVFVGYRWFDENHIEPRFPFGHGLSYTTFAYSDLQLENVHGTIYVNCIVKNVGGRTGAEVVQVYIAPPKSSVPRPPQELKGFAKVTLKSGESKKLRIQLRSTALAYFDHKINKWKAEAGIYQVRIGSSSRDIRLRKNLSISSAQTFERF